MAFLDDSGDGIRRSTALPHDGVIDGLAGLAVPHDDRLALVRDTDGMDAVRVDAALELDLDHAGDLGGEDLHRILLDPARMRIAHRERALGHRDLVAELVKEDGPDARRPGVERHDAALGRLARTHRVVLCRAHDAVHDRCHACLPSFASYQCRKREETAREALGGRWDAMRGGGAHGDAGQWRGGGAIDVRQLARERGNGFGRNGSLAHDARLAGRGVDDGGGGTGGRGTGCECEVGGLGDAALDVG